MSTPAGHPTPSDAGPTLAGMRVLLPARVSAGLAAGLRAAGADVTEVPLTGIAPTPSAELDGRLADLAAGRYDWLALTSATTARLLGPLPLGGANVAAVGAATAETARRAGLPVALVPDTGQGGAALADAWPPGSGRVLIPGARESSPVLASRLRALGWTVDVVSAYQVVPVDEVPAEASERWANGGFDVLVVTAGSVAQAARRLFGPGGPPVVAIGRPSAEAAESFGFDVVAVAATADTAGLVRGLRSYQEGSR